MAQKVSTYKNLKKGNPIPSPRGTPPTCVVNPVASGTVLLGNTLTVTTGTWTFSPTAYTYQWQRSGVDIVGAIFNSYVIVNADLAADIRCVVQAYNTDGQGFAYSNAITGSGGSPSDFPTVYDSRFGTDTTRSAATGWATFAPAPNGIAARAGGARITYVDSTKADDSGDGFSFANAKKTLNAGLTAHMTGYQAGDMLLLVGPGTYTDPGTFEFTFAGGVSIAYPHVVQSVLRSDPTGATTKWGELLGDDRPVVQWTAGNSPSFGYYGNSGTNWYALKGIEFRPSVLGTSDTLFPNGGTHDGQFVQNCLFNNVRWVFTHGDYLHCSKSAGVAPWSTGGNFSCLYTSASGTATGKGQCVEDCTFVRGGWRNGAARNDSIATGGVAGNVLAHGDYFSVDNHFAIRRRIVYVDASIDSRNYRGDLDIAEDLVSWDEPFAGFISGAVGDWSTDNPDGSKVVGSRWLTMGNAYRGGDNSFDKTGGGFNFAIAQAGTGITRGWMFDADVISGYSLISGGPTAITAPDNYFTMDNFRIHNYPQTVSLGGYDGEVGTSGVEKVHCIVTNTVTDSVIPPETSLILSGNTTWGGSPPTVTRALILSDLGFTDANYNKAKAAALNAMITYPHLNWARAIIGAAAARFGDTPSTFMGDTTVPSLAGLPAPRVHYGTTFSSMALSDTSFTSGASKTVNITGVPTNWTVWSDDLPSGFTIASGARTITYDGNTEVFLNTTFTLKCSMPQGSASASTTTISCTISGGHVPLTTAYRAFRLHITDNATPSDNIVSVAEWIIATSSNGANVLSSATMSDDGHFGTDGAANAVDGDITTSWGNSGTVPNNIIADFGASSGNWVIPKEFRIIHRASHGDWGPGNYTVDATVDNPAGSPTWTTLRTITGQTYDNLQTPIRHIIYDLGGGGDTTAPVLTSPVGTKTGATTATIGATTDEGNGTMYGVCTLSSTQPSKAQIKAGQDDTGSTAPFGGATSVSSTGAKTISATGLTAATTYFAHMMHEDASSNQSNRVTSSSFTTDAASTAAFSTSLSSSSYTYANSNHDAICGGSTNNYAAIGNTSYDNTVDKYVDVTLNNIGLHQIGISKSSATISDGDGIFSGNILAWWGADGNVWCGSQRATTSHSPGGFETLRVQIKNGKLYLATVSGGVPTWYLGDPSLNNGYDWWALFGGNCRFCFLTNNTSTYVGDWSHA